MPLSPPILSLAAIGNDLVVCLVRPSFSGATITPGVTINEALRAGHAPLREAVTRLGVRASGIRIALTCPSGICSLRPIGLGIENWSKARDEVLASLGRLFPMTSDNALVGLIDRRPDAVAADSAAHRGYLCAVRRDQINPWLTMIEQALGRAPDIVLAPPMATFGLGLQQTEHAGVIERQPSGICTIHRLEYGEITALSEPWSPEIDESAALAGIRLLEMPTAAAAQPLPGVERIDPQQYAASCALATLVGSAHLAPLHGRTPRRLPAWVAPAAAVLLAVVLVGASFPLRAARYDRAIAEAADQERTIQPEFVRVSALRQEAEMRRNTLQAVVRNHMNAWTPMTPDLAALRAAMPDGAFLYRYTLDANHLTIHGEAPRAADVLLAIERSEAFTAAQQVSPPSSADERGLERFHIRAERRTHSQGQATAPRSRAQGGAR